MMRRLGFASAAAAVCMLSMLAPATSAGADVLDDQIVWNQAVSGDLGVTQVVQVDTTVPWHYWAYGFDVTPDPAVSEPGSGGYLGVQTNGGVVGGGERPRVAIFAIWGGSATGSGGCVTWDDVHGSGTGEGGYGVSCRVEFAWVTGAPITLNVVRDGSGTGPNWPPPHDTQQVAGTYWKATATQGASSTVIGRIFVPGDVHRLTPGYNFSEQFGGGPMPDLCLQAGFATKATFWTPTTQRTVAGGGAESVSAGAPGNRGIVNPCPSRQTFVADGVVVEQGPIVAGTRPPLGWATSASTSGTNVQLSGWVDVFGTTAAIPLRATIDGQPTTATATSTVGTAAVPVRTWTLAVSNPSGGVVCIEAGNGGTWGEIWCPPNNTTGTVDALAGSGAAGRAVGTVAITGFGGAVNLRAVVNGVAGPPNYFSEADPNPNDTNWSRPFDIPFTASAGATICVQANNNGWWTLIGCRAIASGTATITITSGPGDTASGTVNVADWTAAISMRVTADGAVLATGLSASGGGPRGYSLTFDANLGQVVCVEANSYGLWTVIGCTATPTGQAEVLTGTNSTGDVNGVVSLAGFNGQIQVRSVVNGTSQNLAYSSTGAGLRTFSIPFTAAPGQTICVDANNSGAWTRLNCLATNTGTFDRITGTGASGYAEGVVNNPVWSGGILMRVTVDGAMYHENYSVPGSGNRAYSLPVVVGTGNHTVCVWANSYGHWNQLGACRTRGG